MKIQTIKQQLEKHTKGIKTSIGIEYNLTTTVKINGFKPLANIIILDDILEELCFYNNKDFSGSIQFDDLNEITFLSEV